MSKTELQRIQQLNWGIRGISGLLADDVDRGAVALQRKADLHSALAALTRAVDHALEDLIFPPSSDQTEQQVRP